MVSKSSIWRWAKATLTALTPLAAALGCAVALYVGFHLTKDVSFLGDVAEDALDHRQDLFADTKRPRPGEPGFVFVDFEGETLHRLGDPALIPASAVAATLSTLAILKPDMVVVDLDLSGVREPTEVSAVTEALETLSRSGTPVLMAKPILGEGTATPRFASSLLDPLVARDPNLLWVGVDADVSSDGRVRSMSPLVSGWLQERRTVLPSPQLAALLIQATHSTAGAESAFVSGLAGRNQTCAERPAGAVLFCAGDTAVVVPYRGGERIDFTLSWPPKTGLRRETADGLDGGTYVLRIPAWAFLDGTADTAANRFNGRIAVIGSSAADRKDLHITPVGEAPGAFVLINAIRAWTTDGVPSPSDFWAGFNLVLITTFASFLAALAVLRLTPRHFRGLARRALPPALTALLWISFYATGGSASAALIVIQYCTALVILAASRSAAPSSQVPATGEPLP